MPHDPLKALKKATSIGPAKPRIPSQMEEPPVFEEPEPLARFGDIGELIREGIGSSPIGGLMSLLVGGGAATPPKRFPKFILPDGKVLDYTPAKVIREFAGKKVADTTTKHGRMLEGKEAVEALKPTRNPFEKDPESWSSRSTTHVAPTVSSVDELSNLAHREPVTGEAPSPKPITGQWQQGGRASRERMSKLNPDKVRNIRARLANGEQVTDIAADLGVSVSAIGQVKRGDSWNWVK